MQFNITRSYFIAYFLDQKLLTLQLGPTIIQYFKKTPSYMNSIEQAILPKEPNKRSKYSSLNYARASFLNALELSLWICYWLNELYGLASSTGIMLENFVHVVCTVHGLSYLLKVECGGKFERIFWFLCIVASFSFATHVLVGNLIQWEHEPTSVVSVQHTMARFVWIWIH